VKPAKQNQIHRERGNIMTSAISGTGGSLSAAYLKQMQEQMFKKGDKNSDGSITKDELSQMQSSQKSQNGPSVDEIFAQMDSDSDGAISRLESDAGIAKLAQQMQAQGPPPPPPADSSSSSSESTSATQIFDAMDTNKDGTVSASELFAALANKDSSSSDSSATDATSSKDSALFASAIKSYMQASISSFSQSSNEATFSSSAVYG
jgi:Ca2+-binding EF-hand superfamily protein